MKGPARRRRRPAIPKPLRLQRRRCHRGGGIAEHMSRLIAGLDLMNEAGPLYQGGRPFLPLRLEHRRGRGPGAIGQTQWVIK